MKSYYTHQYLYFHFKHSSQGHLTIIGGHLTIIGEVTVY